MESNNKENEQNVFGYPISYTSKITDNFVHIENYGDVTDGYVSKKPLRLVSPSIKKDGHVIEYRLLVSAFFSKEDPYDDNEVGTPYAEVVFIPEYRSLNKHYRNKTMKIAENDVIKLKSDDIFGKMWCEGIGICLLQQSDNFMPFENEEDFKNKFYKAFAHIFHMITGDMDLYLDRERKYSFPHAKERECKKSYWDEIDDYCRD